MEDAYVINLDKNTERWKLMQEAYKDSNLKLHRYSALKMNPGSRGLVQTTLRILRLAKERNLRNLLILEDDCMPLDGWQENWKKVKEWLEKNPDEWDIYSGGSHDNTNPTHIATKDDIAFFQPKQSFCSHWLYIPERSYTKLIDLYTVRNAARKTGNRRIAPNTLNEEVKRLISTPFIAYQRSGFSNLTGKHRNYSVLFKDSERNLRKTLKQRKK